MTARLAELHRTGGPNLRHLRPVRLATAALITTLAACGQTDSALLQRIESLETRLASQENVEARIDRLEAQNRYLSDYVAIWKLQSLYTHHMNRGAVKAIVALFADSPDVEIELSNKGVLRGRDAPHRYFLRAGTKQPVTTDIAPRPPGSLVLHTAVNPAIEIDSTGTRAKAVWLSPGITNLRADGAPIAAWNYGKYQMEYLKQNGEWKILAFRWHQMFLSPYDQGWVKQNIDPGNAGTPIPPDRASDPGFYAPYRSDKVNAFDPAPPVPF